MNENDAELQDAMEMLGAGYNEPAAILESPQTQRIMGKNAGFDERETAAWVKLSTAFKPHIKELKGAPLAVWLYLSLSINRQGIAFPGILTMANELGYSHQGIIDAIKVLEEKGYLKVRRGEKRYNLYEPEFAANGKGKEPVNLVDSFRFNESTFSPNESTFFSNESSGLDPNKKNKSNKINAHSQKKGDLMDGILAYGRSPEAQAIIDIRNRFESLLRLSPGWDGIVWRDFDKWLIGREKENQGVDTWAKWWLSDDFRATRQTVNLTPDKIKLCWLQAFETPKQKQAEEPIPVELTEDKSKYVPMPDYIRRKIRDVTTTAR